MRIAVIGAGRVGSTLGRGLAAHGHTVAYARRDPEAPVPERLQHAGASTGTAEAVVADAEAVILATPWHAAEAAVGAVADFRGLPLLDATNPIGEGMALTHGHTDSGAEAVQRWAPTARVVKVFNSTGVENMADPTYGDQRAMMLACGDDEAAVDTALALATELGFDALSLGPLRNARLLEPFARTWIELAFARKQGRGIAFGLLRR